jgi:hypothetical protein
VRGHNSARIHETFLKRESRAGGFQNGSADGGARSQAYVHWRMDRNRIVQNKVVCSLAQFL